MTEQELAAIEARAAAATAGPWAWDTRGGTACSDRDLGAFVGPSGVLVCEFGNEEQYYPTAGTEPSAADVAFIAAAREDVPALVAEVRRLREEVDWLRQLQHAQALSTRRLWDELQQVSAVRDALSRQLFHVTVGELAPQHRQNWRGRNDGPQ